MRPTKFPRIISYLINKSFFFLFYIKGNIERERSTKIHTRGE